jgi:pilus assembly protein CpaE
MKTKIKVLLAGRSREAISELLNLMKAQNRHDVEVRHIVNGHTDPLHGLEQVPDLLVLHVNGLEGGEIEALIKRPASERPPLVVVSETGDASVMRLAMKAGARDFLPHTEAANVCDSVDAICDELASTDSQQDGELVAFVNAKGGSGATFLACRHGLMHAIDSVGELDAVALEAILASHDSGLKILAATTDDFRFSYDDRVAQCNKLFEVLVKNYQHVIVDVPRRLNEINAEVISRASRVVLIVQQSLPHMHDAMRLQQLMRDQLGVFEDRLQVVVNRFNKKAEISLDDVKKALGVDNITTMPNHFKTVAESINLGVPMYDHARQSPVTKALVELHESVVGQAGNGAAAGDPGKLNSLMRRSSLQQLFRGK